jgi:hypothetical protein
VPEFVLQARARVGPEQIEPQIGRADRVRFLDDEIATGVEARSRAGERERDQQAE